MIVIDRFEGNQAVLEVEGILVDFPRAALPDDAREGTILTFQIVDDTARRREARNRIERLRRRDPGDDDIQL